MWRDAQGTWAVLTCALDVMVSVWWENILISVAPVLRRLHTNIIAVVARKAKGRTVYQLLKR